MINKHNITFIIQICSVQLINFYRAQNFFKEKYYTLNVLTYKKLDHCKS